MSRPLRSAPPKKCRTTLTLPADSLKQAKRIAHDRNVSLSTVVSEALIEGLRSQPSMERSEEIMNGYMKAFAGFSDDEMALLDGVILEPASRR